MRALRVLLLTIAASGAVASGAGARADDGPPTPGATLLPTILSDPISGEAVQLGETAATDKSQVVPAGYLRASRGDGPGMFLRPWSVNNAQPRKFAASYVPPPVYEQNSATTPGETKPFAPNASNTPGSSTLGTNTASADWIDGDSMMHSGVGPGPCPSCADPPHVGADFWTNGMRTGGLVGGAELLLFKPFPGANGPRGPLSNSVAPFRYDPSQRYWLGYVLEDGLGFRMRYFDFDNGSTTITGVNPLNAAQTETINGSLRARLLDFEATQQVSFRRWTMLGSGGLRYGELLESQGVRQVFPGTSQFLSNENSFHGLGLVAGAQAQRSLGWLPNLSLYFFGRGSLLFGNQRQHAVMANMLTGTLTTTNILTHNDNMAVFEIGMGPQWQYFWNQGGSIFVRGGVEAQIYQPSQSTTIDSGSTAMGGFSIAFGLNH
jgi:hypothetical protein